MQMLGGKANNAGADSQGDFSDARPQSQQAPRPQAPRPPAPVPQTATAGAWDAGSDIPF
jgi:hypothetical protein